MVVVCLALAVSAQAGIGNWNVAGPADWMVGTNWAEGAVPSAAKAYVRNGGTAVLSGVAPNITEFDIESGSTVEIKPGASLTGTANWKFGDNGTSGVTGTMIQTGGTLITSGDIYLGDDSDDHGVYKISGGSVELGDDLKLGDDGEGLLELSGTGAITVHGYIAISNKVAPNSVGFFDISGGTLTQAGDKTAPGHGDNDDRLTVADEAPGTLRITGGLATINVSNFEQRSGGTFEAVMNGTGISTINCVGVAGGPASYMDLSGDLNISFAAGDPPPVGFYDLIVADTRVGTFTNITAPANALVTYATGSEIVRIEVVPEPATMSLLAIGGLALIRRRRRN